MSEQNRETTTEDENNVETKDKAVAQSDSPDVVEKGKDVGAPENVAVDTIRPPSESEVPSEVRVGNENENDDSAKAINDNMHNSSPETISEQKTLTETELKSTNAGESNESNVAEITNESLDSKRTESVKDEVEKVSVNEVTSSNEENVKVVTKAQESNSPIANEHCLNNSLEDMHCKPTTDGLPENSLNEIKNEVDESQCNSKNNGACEKIYSDKKLHEPCDTAEGTDEASEGVESHTSDEQELDDDEKADSPAFIPKMGRFYMHDSRNTEEEQTYPPTRSRADGLWKHDKYDEKYQRPKSKRELVNKYGFDIRGEEGPKEDSGKQRTTGSSSRGRGQSRPQRNHESEGRERPHHGYHSAGGDNRRGGRSSNMRRSPERYGKESSYSKNTQSGDRFARSSLYVNSPRGRGGAVASNGRELRRVSNDHDERRGGEPPAQMDRGDSQGASATRGRGGKRYSAQRAATSEPTPVTPIIPKIEWQPPPTAVPNYRQPPPSMLPNSYIQQNDTVYFDPIQQIDRPPIRVPARVPRRLKIEPPA